ncbi:acetyl-CoA carboxylase, carboxyltransferase subunit beta [Halobacteriovorax sp. JY17]|uniref:acetyl-CoA carboxylase, carboxyltransferase subunit beta n=1 Tax=Halobacteriovorax sp. JY17 TaxID=2014617 RepID=UPI000C404A7E|nr:acetyl-CoA carboxylase, carboxyltransferase subunit beta [Halobacteriovorax sp. JY17]PIK15837.1 MAG: acetyl-CoA carboxylase, carboxyltransferase subunit beta [Halobacteriovorax sp. JY17]
MGWFDTVQNPKLKSAKKVSTNTPSGLWKKCTNCAEIVQSDKLDETFQVCPYCDHHFRLSAHERINLLIDEGTFEYHLEDITSSDPLEFTDKKSYKNRLKEAYDKTGLYDGTLCGTGKIDKKEVALCVMNFQFMGGSMGVVTGEKVAHVMDIALEKKIPAIVLCSSGGARMQEGILSLMQMAKTSAARQKLKNAGIPFISILTDPTTGGVAASYAMLGDINIAEPKALIGFAGPRVIEQSIRQTLPQGFQRSEFLLEHGFVDRIIHRHKLKEELSYFIDFFQN